jgi:hypothetical protein
MPADDERAARADYVLRAMAASEIAESCPDPAIRRSFLSLAASWLWRAQAKPAGLCGKAVEDAAPKPRS